MKSDIRLGGSSVSLILISPPPPHNPTYIEKLEYETWFTQVIWCNYYTSCTMATKKKGAKKTGTAKRKSSFTPANRFLRYQLVGPVDPVATPEKSRFIDLAKDLSAVNRRLYRQGKVYQIANITVTSRNTVDGLVSFSTAPDTWVTRGAWRRGFQIFNAMNKKVLDMPGSSSRKGRYHDFKVYLSDDHRTADLERARDNGNNQAGTGEWIYSSYQSPDGAANATDEYNVHLLGGHTAGAGGNDSYASVSLIKSYGESRATVNVDNPELDSQGSDDPLLNLFDAGTQIDEIAADLESDGDQAPYKIRQGTDLSTIGEHYPGSQSNLPKPMVNRIAGIGQQGGSSAPTVMLPGFTAIAGLLEVEIQSTTPNDTFDILIELAPGSYKGVAAFDI